MTLIAGFRAYGFPILMGDFVLSVNEQRSGLQKKVLILGPNCAIAWTGHVLAAEQVFRSLRQRFTGAAVSRQALEDILTAFNSSDFGALDVHLIGWVIEEEQYCFRWRSDWPQELFYGAPLFDGSGHSLMERMCGGAGEFHDEGNPNLVDISLAIDTSLTIATNLMSMEILDQSNLTFGHAYEILYFENGEFRYVDNILYLAATVFLDDDDNITEIVISGVVYKYRVFGEYSITERYNQQAGATDMNVILPIGIRETDEAIRLGRSLILNPYRFPMSSDFYGVFVVFSAANFVSPPIAIVQRGDAPVESRWIYVENQAIYLKGAGLKWMYDLIRGQ